MNQADLSKDWLSIKATSISKSNPTMHIHHIHLINMGLIMQNDKNKLRNYLLKVTKHKFVILQFTLHIKACPMGHLILQHKNEEQMHTKTIQKQLITNPHFFSS